MAFEFKLPESKITLRRNIALLDTNIVCALFSQNDPLHEQTVEYLDMASDIENYFLISHPVLIETCGLLSARKNRGTMLDVIEWVFNEYDVTYLSTNQPIRSAADALGAEKVLMEKFKIDYVDAHLIRLAHLITKAGNMKPFTQIVTCDTSDYMLCSKEGYDYNIFDIRSLELLTFN